MNFIPLYIAASQPEKGNAKDANQFAAYQFANTATEGKEDTSQGYQSILSGIAISSFEYALIYMTTYMFPNIIMEADLYDHTYYLPSLLSGASSSLLSLLCPKD